MTKHKFGSPDTKKKLDCLADYLQAFSLALRDQDFSRIYIDAFAGSGDRTEIRASLPLFGPHHAEPQEVTTPGSARIAVSIEPPLNQIILVEKNESRYFELRKIIAEFPDRDIVVQRDDANEVVQNICKTIQWRGPKTTGRGIRGVVFLDPYGMEVDWKTVVEIGKTEALDCWYFFPLSGLYRNAPLSEPKLTEDKRNALDKIFGGRDWYKSWYDHPMGTSDLFQNETEAIRIADVNAIEKYVKGRLNIAFKGAVLDPIRLYHRNGAPLASLFFAVSNTSAAAVSLATGIASHILKRGSSFQRRSR